MCNIENPSTSNNHSESNIIPSNQLVEKPIVRRSVRIAVCNIERDNDNTLLNVSRPQRIRTVNSLRVRNEPIVPQFIGRKSPCTVNPFVLGGFKYICEFCDALKLKNEGHQCCHNGKVTLPIPSAYPIELKNLLINNDIKSKNFKEYIRQYNSAMAFASFGAKLDLPTGRGPYTFRMHGQIYHRTGSLHHSDNNTPIYSQLYVLDAGDAVQKRISHPDNINCREDIMTILTTLINRINPYAEAYKKMYEIEKEQNLIAQKEGIEPKSISMNIMRGGDQRRYNSPSNENEIAVIFISH